MIDKYGIVLPLVLAIMFLLGIAGEVTRVVRRIRG